YSKVRLLPESLTVDISDQAFSSSIGSLTHSGANEVTSMLYAVAMDCKAPRSATGEANINLRYTPFAIHPDGSFVVGGHIGDGGANFDDARQRVELRGGGNCGCIAPAPAIDLPY